MDSITKVCAICRIEKNVDEFGRSGKYINSYCRTCTRIRDAERYPREKERRIARRKKHYEENRDATLKTNKEYREKNKEKKLEWDRQYNKDNREKINATKRARYFVLKILGFDFRKFYRDKYAKNAEQFREKAKIRNNNRRAREKGNGGKLTRKEWQEVLEKYGNKCLCCGSEEITIDHVLPISKGGKHVKDNVQPLCKSCNSRKKDRYIDYRNGTR